MKLSINQESVTALREYAASIPKIINDITEGMEQLSRTYVNVCENIGPHRDEFDEMVRTIQKFNNTSSQFIEEIPYMLNSTADKMESYIAHSSYASGSGAIANNSIDVRYKEAVTYRLNSEDVDELSRNLYSKYEANVRIADGGYLGTPFYDSYTKGISLNYMADLHNPTGQLSTYFHEVGHMIDDVSGNGELFLSTDNRFENCLREDAERYVQQTMIQEACEREDAYDIISDRLWGDYYAGVSDIFGSLTDCQCQGSWGHSKEYWKQDETHITKEAFANMFEASLGPKRKQELIEEFFPTAYCRYKELIGGVI